MECRKSGYAEKQAYLLYGLCQRKLGTFKRKTLKKSKKLEKKRIKKRTKRIVRKVKRRKKIGQKC
jgi:hypothetical protein